MNLIRSQLVWVLGHLYVILLGSIGALGGAGDAFLRLLLPALSRGRLRWRGIRLSKIVPLWGETSWRLTKEWALDVRYHPWIDPEALSYPKPLGKGEIALVICNHPDALYMDLLVRWISRELTDNIRVVAKREILWQPWFSLPLLLAGIGTFVDRTSRERSREQISKAFSSLEAGTALLVIPDQRFTKERHNKTIAQMGGKIAGLADWLSFTLLPRTGALRATIERLAEAEAQGLTVRVFFLTMACEYDVSRFSALGDLVGSKYLLVTRERPFSYFTRGDLAAALNELWYQANCDIARLRGDREWLWRAHDRRQLARR